MKQLAQAWQRFWFTSVAPENLAICRILFFGGLLAFYFSRNYDGWGVMPPEIYIPQTLVAKAGIPVASPQGLLWISIIWKISMALACVGYRARLAMLTAALAGTYLLSIPHDFGKVNHNDQVLVFILWLMACSRCADALSADRWLQQRKNPNLAPPKPTGEYLWPVRAVWVVLALVFFSAGVAKIRYGGIKWLEPDTIRYHLVSHNYPFMSFQPWTDWGLYLAQYSWVCSGIAIFTVLVESLFPLALFSRKARLVFVSAAFMMQLGIRAMMGPHFEVYVLGYLFFVPWAALIARKTSPPKSTPI